MKLRVVAYTFDLLSNIKRKINSSKTSSSFVSVLRTITFILFVFFLLSAALGTFVYPFIDKTSIYNITADVEQVVVRTHQGAKANWYFNDIEIIYPCSNVKVNGCIENEYGELSLTTPNFSGSLKLANNVEIIITRTGN